MKLGYIIKTIEKDLEERTVKHPITERARNIGKTGTWEKTIDPLSGEELDEITYKDGTKIRFLGGVAEIVSPDGETIKYEGNDRVGEYTEGYETFANDWGKQIDIDFGGEYAGLLTTDLYMEGHEIICESFLNDGSASEYIKEITPLIEKYGPNSKQVQEKREEYREIIKKEMPENHRMEEFDDDIVTDMVLELSEGFDNRCKQNHFNTSFLTLTTEKNPDITKRINTNENWKKEMSLAGDDAVNTTAKGDGFGVDDWVVINMREATNPANCGIDLFTPTPNLDTPGHYNGYFLTAPGQKTETYIIDEKNKIIVQRPYKEGMEGHY